MLTSRAQVSYLICINRLSQILTFGAKYDLNPQNSGARRPALPNAIPLIRAAILDPFRSWMAENGIDVSDALASVGLDWVPSDDPLLPIPLLPLARLLSLLEATAGPDVPRQIVQSQKTFDLGSLSAFMVAAGNPAEAFFATTRFIPYHSTHEFLSVKKAGGSIEISSGWFLRFDSLLTLHLVQQFSVSVVARICAEAGCDDACILNVQMMPHPTFGLAHLRDWLGDRVDAVNDRELVMTLDSKALTKPFNLPTSGKDQLIGLEDIDRLSNTAKLSDSIARLLPEMLPKKKPSIDDFANFANLSRRSLQRRLADERVVFSEVVDQARFNLASAYLASGDLTRRQISERLGFERPETLSRALKRWNPDGFHLG